MPDTHAKATASLYYAELAADYPTVIEADLFTSSDLPAHRQRLDAFEGADYERIVVPFFDDSGFVAEGNVYVLKGRGEMQRTPPATRGY